MHMICCTRPAPARSSAGTSSSSHRLSSTLYSSAASASHAACASRMHLYQHGMHMLRCESAVHAPESLGSSSHSTSSTLYRPCASACLSCTGYTKRPCSSACRCLVVRVRYSRVRNCIITCCRLLGCSTSTTAPSALHSICINSACTRQSEGTP